MIVPIAAITDEIVLMTSHFLSFDEAFAVLVLQYARMLTNYKEYTIR